MDCLLFPLGEFATDLNKDFNKWLINGSGDPTGSLNLMRPKPQKMSSAAFICELSNNFTDDLIGSLANFMSH